MLLPTHRSQTQLAGRNLSPRIVEVVRPRGLGLHDAAPRRDGADARVGVDQALSEERLAVCLCAYSESVSHTDDSQFGRILSEC